MCVSCGVQGPPASYGRLRCLMCARAPPSSSSWGPGAGELQQRVCRMCMRWAICGVRRAKGAGCLRTLARWGAGSSCFFSILRVWYRSFQNSVPDLSHARWRPFFLTDIVVLPIILLITSHYSVDFNKIGRSAMGILYNPRIKRCGQFLGPGPDGENINMNKNNNNSAGYVVQF